MQTESGVTKQFNENNEALTRYWIARYCSYPVMWTLGQEVDDGINYKIDMLVITYIDIFRDTDGVYSQIYLK